MGYYSAFRISTYHGVDLPSDFKKHLEDLSDYSFAQISSYMLEPDNTIKWYAQEEHMTTISKAYPTLLLQVYRNGEDDDDEYIYYYLNGVQEASQVIKTFAPPSFISTAREFGTVKSLS